MDDRAARVRVSGPLTQHAEGFRAMLAGRGYAPSSAAGQLQVMAHLSRWLAQQGRPAGEVTPTDVEQFLLVRKGAGYRRWLSARGIAPLLEYLEAARLIVPAVSAGPLAPDSGVLAGYRDYLVTERGLAASTIRNYLDAAMLLAAQDGMRLDALTADDVTRFVLAQCRNCSTGSATVLVTGLRSLLRYLHLAGFTSVSLADAVPSAASASPLPEATGPSQASRLLRSCDRGTAAGLRDYAVLVLLVRLGLRVSEVAAMQLGDIDWRAGELTIRGKGSRLDQLPLPADAGQAIAAWLSSGRPRLLVPAGLHDAAGSARPAERESGLSDREAGGPPRRAGNGDRAPAAARRSDRTAAGRREPARGGPGAPPCQHAEHCPVCQGRSRRAVGGGPPVAGSRAMNELSEAAACYLATRRALGFRLEGAGRHLEQFAAFAEAAGQDTVTTELALQWSTLPASRSRAWHAQRLSAVRGFARWLHTVDPQVQVPPAGLLPGRVRRAVPYLYSEADITALIDAAGS